MKAIMKEQYNTRDFYRMMGFFKEGFSVRTWHKGQNRNTTREKN